MKVSAIKFISVAALSISSQVSFAAGEVGSGPNPFVDCGIGAALFPNTDWAAVSSNVIWDIGTTAVTSATASPETCSKKSVKTAMFIRDSYAQIVEDAARGNGASLVTALEMFDCSGNNQARAIADVRARMKSTVQAPGYATQDQAVKAGQMFNTLDAAAKNSCSA